MIDYGPFQFASPPRTASTWFMKAAAIAGFGEGHKAVVHDPSAYLPQKLSVSLVRHPADWLRSYWAAIRGGYTGVTVVDALSDNAKEAETADYFLWLVARRDPGIVGAIHKVYNANNVIRVEDLPWAAIEFFASLGVSKDKTAQMAVLGPQNAYSCVYRIDRKTRAVVVAVEQEFCESYEYH